MTYLVNEDCIKCKHMDCGVCEPECPVNAILADNAFGVPEEAIKWEEINRKYSEVWPNITQMRKEDVPADAEDWNGVPNKLEEHFSEKPGKGD